jgi:uncharacterized protein
MNETLERVRAVFQQADGATEKFARATGISCPPGCGNCCQFPDIEASELEMMPVARQLLESGEAGAFLEKLQNYPTDKVCVFFEATPGSSTEGRCGRYHQRPLVCRLFGFAGRKNKDGRPQFTPCPIHQQTCAEKVDAARVHVDRGTLRPPLYSDFTDALWATHPTLGLDRFPINQALRRALERVLTTQHYLTNR